MEQGAELSALSRRRKRCHRLLNIKIVSMFSREKSEKVLRCELKSHSAGRTLRFLITTIIHQLANTDPRKLHFNRPVERNQKFDTDFHL